jgi:hypothetical protein
MLPRVTSANLAGSIALLGRKERAHQQHQDHAHPNPAAQVSVLAILSVAAHDFRTSGSLG